MEGENVFKDGIFNIVNMLILPKFTYRVNTIATKISAGGKKGKEVALIPTLRLL